MSKEYDDTTFYDLMQSYRHALIEEQGAVNKAFNDVKDYFVELIQAAEVRAYERGYNEAKKALTATATVVTTEKNDA